MPGHSHVLSFEQSTIPLSVLSRNIDIDATGKKKTDYDLKHLCKKKTYQPFFGIINKCIAFKIIIIFYGRMGGG